MDKKKLSVCGVCDDEEPYLQAAVVQLSTAGYLDYREFVRQERPDFVVMALPNNVYPEVIPFFVENHIDTLKEKPYGRTLREAREFRRLASEGGVSLSIAQQRFFSPHYLSAKEWLDRKRIGELISFEYKHTVSDMTNSWYWDVEAGGGCWLNVGWHMCFAISWLFGKPDSFRVSMVSSSARPWKYLTDDTVIFNCQYDSGLLGTGYVSVVAAQREHSLIVRGTAGAVRIGAADAMLVDNYNNIIETTSRSDEVAAYCLQIESVFSPLLYGEASGAANSLEFHNTQTMEMIEAGFNQNIDASYER